MQVAEGGARRQESRGKDSGLAEADRRESRRSGGGPEFSCLQTLPASELQGGRATSAQCSVGPLPALSTAPAPSGRT